MTRIFHIFLLIILRCIRILYSTLPPTLAPTPSPNVPSMAPTVSEVCSDCANCLTTCGTNDCDQSCLCSYDCQFLTDCDICTDSNSCGGCLDICGCLIDLTNNHTFSLEKQRYHHKIQHSIDGNIFDVSIIIMLFVINFCYSTLPPTEAPTTFPSRTPSHQPTHKPTSVHPTGIPSMTPTHIPITPSDAPTKVPTGIPTMHPTAPPTTLPFYCARDASESVLNACVGLYCLENPLTCSYYLYPTSNPTLAPSNNPTDSPTKLPTNQPTNAPTNNPTTRPTDSPSHVPTSQPTPHPSAQVCACVTPAPTGICPQACKDCCPNSNDDCCDCMFATPEIEELCSACEDMCAFGYCSFKVTLKHDSNNDWDEKFWPDYDIVDGNNQQYLASLQDTNNKRQHIINGNTNRNPMLVKFLDTVCRPLTAQDGIGIPSSKTLPTMLLHDYLNLSSLTLPKITNDSNNVVILGLGIMFSYGYNLVSILSNDYSTMNNETSRIYHPILFAIGADGTIIELTYVQGNTTTAFISLQMDNIATITGAADGYNNDTSYGNGLALVSLGMQMLSRIEVLTSSETQGVNRYVAANMTPATIRTCFDNGTQFYSLLKNSYGYNEFENMDGICVRLDPYQESAVNPMNMNSFATLSAFVTGNENNNNLAIDTSDLLFPVCYMDMTISTALVSNTVTVFPVRFNVHLHAETTLRQPSPLEPKMIPYIPNWQLYLQKIQADQSNYPTVVKGHSFKKITQAPDIYGSFVTSMQTALNRITNSNKRRPRQRPVNRQPVNINIATRALLKPRRLVVRASRGTSRGRGSQRRGRGRGRRSQRGQIRGRRSRRQRGSYMQW